MNTNIFNTAYKTSTISLKRLNLMYNHFYKEPRFTIPFIGVEDRSEFNFSIIFNASCMATNDDDFGNNSRFSLYRKFTKSQDGQSWNVVTCDEYNETFLKTGQTIKIRKIKYDIFLAETQPLKLYVSEDEKELRIVDSSETHTIYKTINDYNYPDEVCDKYCNYVCFQDLSNGFRYFNELDFIDFIKDSNGLIDTINVHHHNTKTAFTKLTYEDGTITRAKLYRIKNGVETLIEDYEFSYDLATDKGYFKEIITNESMLTQLDWSNGLLVQKGVGLTELNKSKYEVLSLFTKYTSSSSNPNYRLKHYYIKNKNNYFHAYDVDTFGNVNLIEKNAAGYSLYGAQISYDEALDGNLNLLLNGSFISSTDNWNIETGSVTIFDSTSNVEPCNNQCPKEALINQGTVISQSLYTKIKPNEGIRLSFFYCDDYGNEGEDNTLMGTVKLELTKMDNSKETKRVDLYHGVVQMNLAGIGSYGFKCLDFLTKEEYKSIKVIVENNTELPFYVKGFKLTKGNLGRTYTYDSLNRLTGVSSINNTQYFNDLDGNVVGEFSSKKDYKEHKYGEYNILLETKDSLGNLTINTYDSYYFNKVIKAITYYDNYYQQIDKTYTNLGKDVQTETGINNKTTTYNKNVSTRLMDSITDPRGIVYSYLYNGKNLTINNAISDGTNLSSVTMDYYEDANVKEYVNDNLKYLFTYNNEGKLKSVIKIDSSTNIQEILVQIQYDYEQDTTKLISDNIHSITDRNNYTTSFEYDLFGNVIKILRGDKVFNFDYDNLQRLKKTYEGTLNNPLNQIEYTYNIRGQLVKENKEDLQIEYIYDEEGKLVEKIFGETSNLYSEKINNMDCSKKNLYHNKLAVHSHYGFGCFFEKNKAIGAIDTSMRNNFQQELTSSGIVATHNGKFGYLNCTSSTSMNYSGLQLIGLDSKTGLPLSGSLAFAFKVDSGNTGCLFCLRFVNNICVYGKVELSGTKTYLNIYSQPTGSATLMYSTDISDKLGKWISIGFSYDENTKLTTFVCDDKTFAQQKMLYYSLVGVSSSLYLGCLKLSGSSVVNNLTCQITNVILTRLQLTQNELLDINNENINFLNQNSLFLNKENSTNFAQSLTLKKETVDSLFPLNRTLKNRVNDGFEVKKKKFGEELFVYNTEIKDYVFNAKGNLIGKNQYGSCITVVANIYFENITSSYSEYLLELVDGKASAILYRTSDNKLGIGLGTAARRTNLVIPNETWSTISFGLQPVLSSDSVDVEYYNFRLTVNGEVFETQIPTGIDMSQVFNTFNVYFGGVYESDKHVTNAQVNNVYIVDSYLSLDTINNFLDNETIVYHEYNSIGQLIEEGVKTKARNITKKTYQYETSGNRNLGNLVQVIQDGVEQVVEMDSFGNITKLGNTIYEYDYLNRLKKVTGPNFVNYEYDDKGNIISITKNGSTRTFTYDNDRIKSYGGNQVTYDQYNRISSYGALSFTWTGKQLTNVTTSSSIYSYEYNQNGLRIKKTNTSNNTYMTYSYEGDKLIKQYDGTNKVFYLYDDNGVLYGLIWNGTKYFYRRNVISEIIDIIDINGNVVVTYTYDPYGKLMSTTGSLASTLGVINSMLYKGYVYDVETQLYWVSSRYYSPELCRWISPDSIEYLDPQNINGLNLYAYAQNNPIMYYDPTGHSAESIWKIVGSVAIIAALGVLTIVSAGATSGLLAVAAPIISGAFWGATAGAITGGITGALNAYSSGGSILDGVADGMFSGTLSGAATGAISGAFSYLQFPTSFLNKIDPNIRFLPEMLNIGVQTLGNGVISMTSSLLSGNSIEAAKMAFLFGMAGGFMGANVAGQVAKSVWRSGLDSLGLSASEYLVTQWLGV